jgi:hypothetical protein
MTSRPEDAGLAALQAAFGRALSSDVDPPGDAFLERVPGSDGDLPIGARLDVYRNNAWQGFLGALKRAYPVLMRRVGEDFFRQLAREYRQAHPSRSGDLHWAGAEWPAWLSVRLAGSEYAWLADLARLEWACEEAACARDEPPVPSSALSEHSAEALEHLRLDLHASVRRLKSPYPLFSVWQANQGVTEAAPVDLAAGGECCVVSCTGDRVAVYRLEPAVFNVVDVIAAGGTLCEAASASGDDAMLLGRVLAWLFAERLVVGVNPSAQA